MTTTTRSAGTRVRPRRVGGARAIETAVLALVALSVAFVVAVPHTTPETGATRPVRVRAGETLWDLAARHPLSGATTAETVAAIRKVNNLEGSRLVAGSVVLVPAPDAAPSLSAKR